jgi:hypothetical protein
MRARRGSALRPLTLVKQLALGLAIFAGVLAASVPLAFVSEGLALGAAVAVASVLVALLARRLRISLLVATLLAVLGAFATSHSVHLAQQSPAIQIRLADLSPGTGLGMGEAPAPPPAVVVLPPRIMLAGELVPIGAWVFPSALFLLWAVGFAAIRASGALARWLWHRLERTAAA